MASHPPPLILLVFARVNLPARSAAAGTSCPPNPNVIDGRPAIELRRSIRYVTALRGYPVRGDHERKLTLPPTSDRVPGSVPRADAYARSGFDLSERRRKISCMLAARSGARRQPRGNSRLLAKGQGVQVVYEGGCRRPYCALTEMVNQGVTFFHPRSRAFRKSPRRCDPASPQAKIVSG